MPPKAKRELSTTIVHCYHGEQANTLVSHTPRNPGREFYVCNKPQSDRCGFWFWADDPIFTTTQVTAHTSSSLDAPVSPANGLCTPRPTPLHATSTSQQTPTRRRRTEAAATDPPAAQTSTVLTSAFADGHTPSKRARLEAIEAGLRARIQDQTSQQPPHLVEPTGPEKSDTLPFTHGVEANEAVPTSSLVRETITDVEQQVRPPRVRYSFLGLPPTQEPQCNAEPSTPKKRPFSSTSDRKQDLLGHCDEASSSTLLTPPQSVHRIEVTESGNNSPRSDPVTPTRYKGKERASAHWDRILETEENPFVDTTPSYKLQLETDAPKRVSCSRRSSVGSPSPPCTPTAAERITSHIAGIRDTIHALYAYANDFDKLDAIKYIERLERQKNALALSEEAKTKKIAALTVERDQLKEKLRQSDERSRAKGRVIASFRA